MRNPSAKEDIAKIDKIISDIKDKQKDHTWQPSEKELVKVIHERRAYENRLKTMATGVKLAGGKVKEEF